MPNLRFSFQLLIVVLSVLMAASWATGAEETRGGTQLYKIVSEPKHVSAESSRVVKRASIIIAPALFDLHKHSDDERLLFPTFAGVVRGRTTWRRIDGPDSFALGGVIESQGTGHFIVTVHHGVTAMVFHDDDWTPLRVERAAHGYVLQQTDLDALPPCGACQTPHSYRMGGTATVCSDALPYAADKDGHVQIDVLVVYTGAVLAEAGSVETVEALIQSSADYANLAYANSGIPLTVNIVHMAEIDYKESYATPVALVQLTYPDDGYMDEVHDLRDAYDADMVSLITRSGTVSGIGWILDSLDETMDQRAFSITLYHALGYSTWTHELGHNMGCDHEAAHATAEGWRLFNYSRGWVFRAEADNQWYGTVMAYGGARIPYFSNPDVSYRGTPTGVPAGEPDEAHCAQTITISAPHIARNRPRIQEGEAESEGEGEGNRFDSYYCDILWSLYNNYLLRSLLPPFANAVIDQFNPNIADLNGGTLGQEFYGNGMLDCAFELGLLHRILDTPGLDLSDSGGVTHALAAEAMDHNWRRLKGDIGSYAVSILDAIAPGLIELAAAYITLGDEGSLDFIGGLWQLVSEVYWLPTLNFSNYRLLPEFLSANGDADGDGATNREEYEAFAGYGPDVYVSFALNPTVYPETTEGEGEIPAEGEAEIPAEGEAEIPAEGEAETPAEGEAETPAEGEAETPAEGEGETSAEGEGEIPAEGEGETSAEGEDEIPPEGERPLEFYITLIGEADLRHECGDEFKDPGAVAFHTDRTELTVMVEGHVDSAVVGVYTLRYTTWLGEGPTLSVERTVTVEDTRAPTLVLSGAADVHQGCLNLYWDMGLAMAQDACDGDLISRVQVDILQGAYRLYTSTLRSITDDLNGGYSGKAGDYTLRYHVADNAGNTSAIERSVSIDCETPLVVYIAGLLLSYFDSFDANRNDMLDEDEMDMAHEVVFIVVLPLWRSRFDALIADIQGAADSITKALLQDYLDAPRLAVTPGSHDAVADAGATAAFTVTTAAEWTVMSDSYWATPEPTHGSGTDTFMAVCDENTGEARTAMLNVQGNGTSPRSVSVRVLQKAMSEGEGEAPAEGEDATPIEGEGDSEEGEGTSHEGEGEPEEGEDEPHEGEDVLPIEGEGEPHEGEHVLPIEGEGKPEEGEDRGCCFGCRRNDDTSESGKRFLDDWLLVGLAFMLLLTYSAQRKY